MKHLYHALFLCLFLFPAVSFAQLPDGSVAPDFTLTDINGNTHHLYDLLDDGKMVVLEFSATWCGPCWNYMLSGALEDFWNEYGPNGTDQAQVFYIEADFSTGMADLMGQTASSQGNWIANIPFPIIDLQPGENTANDYDINYYPTLYAVCSDHLLYELGQVPASVWAEFIQSCSLAADVADVVDAECYGTGSATLDVSGGVSPITYIWSNGDHDATLNNVGAGTYSVTVTEHNGKFVVLDDIEIGGADAPISLAYEEIEDVLCNGTATGNISIQPQDGVAPYEYDWSNGSHAQNLSNVPADEYTVNITDSHGCLFETSFVIDEPEPIEVESEMTPDYCDLSNGTIALSIQGGVGGFEISASEGSIHGNTIEDLPAGSVDVEVEDNNGCVWANDFEVEAEAAPDLYFSPNPHITCVQPTTVVTGYVNQGSGEFTYSWTTTNGHISGPANQSSVTVDAAGDYTLEVNDVLTGCEVQDQVAVTSLFDPPPASAGDDSPISCENLILTLNGSGGDAYTVSWSTTNGHIVSGGNTYNPVVDASGEYTITVYNPANNCSNTDVVTVINDVHPAQAQYNYQSSGLTILANDQSSGSNVTGWTWNFGDGGTSNEQNAIHTFAAPGVYQVCLTVHNGCGENQLCQNVEVTFVGSVIQVDAAITNVQCNADTTGAISLVVNGGSGVYTYSWTGPNGSTYSTPSIENLPAGNYQIVVSDDVGNVFIGEFGVTEPTAIVLDSSSVVHNLCFGENNGSLALNISGGVGPFLYAFNGEAAQLENIATNLGAGDVTCVVTDANGCSFLTGPYAISQPAELTYQGNITPVRCFGEANGAASVVLGGGVAPYTYLWSLNGNTTPDISQVVAGSYTCQVTDQNGCIDNLNIEIPQPALLEASNVVVIDAHGSEQNNGSISIEPIGGTAPYSVTWSNGGTGNKIEGLVPGEYTYVITDANGCNYSPSAPVVVNGIVATERVDWSAFIHLTPNPSDGNVVLSWNDLHLGAGNIHVMTLDGKHVASRQIEDYRGNWDMSALGLQNGVYVVVFNFNKQTIPVKLIVLN